MSKTEKIKELFKEAAAAFFNVESNRTSLITVTDTEISEGGRRVTMYLSVLPEEHEEQALSFAKRRRSDFREFIKEKTRVQRIPTFDFELDKGERHRQRIEELLSKELAGDEGAFE